MQRKLQKKRTNITAFVQERYAIIEGINAGLADVKAGRIYPHEQAIIYITRKLKSLKRGTTVNFVEKLGPSSVDPKADLKKLYYEENAEKNGFGETGFSN